MIFKLLILLGLSAFLNAAEVHAQAAPDLTQARSLLREGQAGAALPISTRSITISEDRRLTVVPVKLGATVELGTPQALFAVPPPPNLVVANPRILPSRDGQRFLVNAPAGGEGPAGSPVTVVLNWQAGLRK